MFNTGQVALVKCFDERSKLGLEHLHSFEVEGQYFMSTYHFLVFKKALRYREDSKFVRRICEAKSQEELLNLERRIRNVVAVDWGLFRERVVCMATLAKVLQDSELFEELSNQSWKEAKLAFAVGNRFWGIGWDLSRSEAKCPERWVGENRLGIVVSKVVQYLSEEGRS